MGLHYIEQWNIILRSENTTFTGVVPENVREERLRRLEESKTGGGSAADARHGRLAGSSTDRMDVDDAETVTLASEESDAEDQLHLLYNPGYIIAVEQITGSESAYRGRAHPKLAYSRKVFAFPETKLNYHVSFNWERYDFVLKGNFNRRAQEHAHDAAVRSLRKRGHKNLPELYDKRPQLARPQVAVPRRTIRKMKWVQKQWKTNLRIYDADYYSGKVAFNYELLGPMEEEKQRQRLLQKAWHKDAFRRHALGIPTYKPKMNPGEIWELVPESDSEEEAGDVRGEGSAAEAVQVARTLFDGRIYDTVEAEIGRGINPHSELPIKQNEEPEIDTAQPMPSGATSSTVGQLSVKEDITPAGTAPLTNKAHDDKALMKKVMELRVLDENEQLPEVKPTEAATKLESQASDTKVELQGDKDTATGPDTTQLPVVAEEEEPEEELPDFGDSD